MYRSTLSLTSAPDGGGWSTPGFGRFITGKENRYPYYRKLGGRHGRSGRVRTPHNHRDPIPRPSSQ